LALVCYADQPAIHSDRLRDAAMGYLRFLVAECDRAIPGFGLIVFGRPPTWPNGGTTDRLPAILDLHVAEARRGQGIGTAMIKTMEQIVVDKGGEALFLSVDPVDNPRVEALYTRLGYRALQAEPYRDRWRFVDSAGAVHEGEDWQIDMVKAL
jgi:GNAT superfamily N-acetyltransferase